MRRLALCLAAALLALPTSLPAQIPALSTMPDVDSARLQPLRERIRDLSPRADQQGIHEHIEAALDSAFAAGCSEVFKKVRSVLSQGRGECFWGKHEVSALNLGNVTATGNTGSLYTDLSTAYFGPLRLSFSTLVAASGDEDEEGDVGEDQDARAAFQRLIAGGGNLVASIQAPLLHYRAARVNGLRFTTALLARGAADVGSLGADSARAQSRSFAGAADMRVQLNSNDRLVALFGYAKGKYVRGSDPIPAFLMPENPTQGPERERSHLFYAQGSVGARLLDAVVVTYTYYACPQCGRAGVSNQVSITAQKSGL
jgi:hypothetical protein